MSKIETGRYAEALRRSLNIPGQGGPGELAPEISAVIGLEPFPPEYPFLVGSRYCAGFGGSSADAGNVSNVQLRNPPGSGILCIVQSVFLAALATGSYRMGWTTTALGTLGTAPALDSRYGVGSVSACQIGTGVSAASILNSGLVRFRMIADTTLEFPFPVVITAGNALNLDGEFVNRGLHASFRWFERPAENYERA